MKISEARTMGTGGDKRLVSISRGSLSERTNGSSRNGWSCMTNVKGMSEQTEDRQMGGDHDKRCSPFLQLQ